jgi:hypothetical protein
MVLDTEAGSVRGECWGRAWRPGAARARERRLLRVGWLLVSKGKQGHAPLFHSPPPRRPQGASTAPAASAPRRPAAVAHSRRRGRRATAGCCPRRTAARCPPSTSSCWSTATGGVGWGGVGWGGVGWGGVGWGGVGWGGVGWGGVGWGGWGGVGWGGVGWGGGNERQHCRVLRLAQRWWRSVCGAQLCAAPDGRQRPPILAQGHAGRRAAAGVDVPRPPGGRHRRRQPASAAGGGRLGRGAALVPCWPAHAPGPP